MRSRKFFILLGFLTTISFILGSQTAQSLDPTRGSHSANQITSGTMTGPIEISGAYVQIPDGTGGLQIWGITTPDLGYWGGPNWGTSLKFYSDVDILANNPIGMVCTHPDCKNSTGNLNIAGSIRSGGGLTLGDSLQQGLPNNHIPQNTVIRLLGDMGLYTGHPSIAIGGDGLPIIAYQSGSPDYDLSVYKCQNIDCSSGFSRKLNTHEAVGLSITIATDGFPIITFRNGATNRLAIYKCEDVDCANSTGRDKQRDLETYADTGRYNSITTGSDGLSVIAYYDTTNADLKFYKCNDVDCTAGSSRILDSSGIGVSFREATSIAIGIDGFPIISYVQDNDQDMKVYKCNNLDCSAGNTVTIDSSTSSYVGPRNSLAIGADGLPVMSYLDDINRALLFRKCLNIACTSLGPVRSLASGIYAYESWTAIAIGTDNFPIISYNHDTDGVMLYRCLNMDCSSGFSVKTGEGYGSDIAITIGSDGTPILSYVTGLRDNSLKFAKCSNQNCVPYWTRR